MGLDHNVINKFILIFYKDWRCCGIRVRQIIRL